MKKVMHISDIHAYGNNYDAIDGKVGGLEYLPSDNYYIGKLASLLASGTVEGMDYIVITGDLIYASENFGDKDVREWALQGYRKVYNILNSYIKRNSGCKVILIGGNHDNMELMVSVFKRWGGKSYTILDNRAKLDIGKFRFSITHRPEDIVLDGHTHIHLTGHVHKFTDSRNLKRDIMLTSGVRNCELNVGAFSFCGSVGDREATANGLVGIGRWKNGETVYSSSYYNVYTIQGDILTLNEYMYIE